jgi:hypothetical protein
LKSTESQGLSILGGIGNGSDTELGGLNLGEDSGDLNSN